MKEKREKILNLILPITVVLAIIAIWTVMASTIKNEFILPSVTEALSALLKVLKNGLFYRSLLGTLLRTLVAFIFSFVVAIMLAVLSCKNNVAERLISPIMSVMRALPTIAVVLLLLLWTNSNVASVIVTILVVLPTVFTNVQNALLSIDKTICEAAKMDGADEKRVFLSIEVPLIKPSVFSAIGSGFSLNFKLMVAAEVIAQTARSIGYMLNTAKAYFETAEMIALVCVTVVIGLFVESVFNWLSKKARE